MKIYFIYLFYAFSCFGQVAAEVAAPLAKTDQIVIVGDQSSNVTGEVSKLVSQLPPAVQALTGVDLSGVSLIYFPSCNNNNNYYYYL